MHTGACKALIHKQACVKPNKSCVILTSSRLLTVATEHYYIYFNITELGCILRIAEFGQH